MRSKPRVEYVPIEALTPHPRNARTHSKRQISKLAEAIHHFGWASPLVVDETGLILAGHGRLLAAQKLKLSEVPIIRLANMTEADKRAFMLADNKIAADAGWDPDLLALELEELSALDIEIELTGFEIAAIDAIIERRDASDPAASAGPEDDAPERPSRAVTRSGDLWRCGRHLVLCGDARDTAGLARLLDGEHADLVFTDPPYNVPVAGHVRVARGHRDFEMAVGEMSAAEFKRFLEDTLGQAAQACKDGAVIFVCMDWRHAGELIAAAKALRLIQLNLCVWEKTNGGMGSLYRSQHELVFVFKKGQSPHINNIQLGATGRYRTNIWRYAGVNAFKQGRSEELTMHPTVKPVALVEDAIKDVTKRNALVLDCFGGSGTTLIAAERCGRRARLIEYDPHYCDVIVQRFERYTGKAATLISTGQTFEDVAQARAAPPDTPQ
ncbi:MAG: DNA methyltransferase [Caulobacterales bacterium]